MPRLFVPLMVLLHSLSGEPTGIYVADSTKLVVCHTRRIHRHKVFDGLAARGIHPLRPGPIWTVRIRREINAPCQWKLCRSMA